MEHELHTCRPKLESIRRLWSRRQNGYQDTPVAAAASLLPLAPLRETISRKLAAVHPSGSVNSQAAATAYGSRGCGKTLPCCHSESFAVILSEAKNLALPAQDKLREESRSARHLSLVTALVGRGSGLGSSLVTCHCLQDSSLLRVDRFD